MVKNAASNEPIPEFYFKNRHEWRRWLEENHEKIERIFLVYYKKNTGLESITYDEAVEEALCFGWIDSKINSIDNLRYRQIYTPRKPKSVWSALNKSRVEKMIAEGKMTPAGYRLIEEARKSGWWDKAYTSRNVVAAIPDDLQQALEKDALALENFMNFSNSSRNTYIFWIENAKQDVTRQKRIARVVENARNNIKPGII